MKEVLNLKFSKIKEAISGIGFKQTNDKPQHLPVLRKLSVGKQYLVFTSLVVASIGGSFGLFFKYFDRSAQLDQRVESSTNLKMLSQRVAKNLQKAILGNDVSYKLIEIDIETLNFFIEKYKNGFADFEKLEPGIVEAILHPIQEKYNVLHPKMELLLKNKNVVVGITRESKNITQSFNDLNRDLDQLYIVSVQRGVSQVKLVALQTLQASILSFSENINDAATSSNVDIKLLADLTNDYATIQKMLKYLLEDEPFEDAYSSKEFARIKKVYGPQFDKIPALLKQMGPLIEGKTAALESLGLFDNLYYDSDKLRDISEEEKADLIKINYYGYILSAFAFLFIMLLGYTNLKEAQIRAWQTKRDNDETDEAVISLMEELIPISEGNLKARTTITTHVTGALADRINFMAESLQSAIKNTRETSENVASQMTQVRNMIAEASELSKTAEQTAKESNEASVTGSNMVNEAAEKMEEARNKMQETSKRVKRLGEVSQSIGLVTDLIEEMTEKTAVLALNTQLKAAESGSDGNSFRVIAEEIRKLSDEAKKSLSTIRNNVQNMQSETNTVMLSIEQTTSNVVEGSLLWEKAEADLKLIQEAAKKIENITLQLNALSSKQVEKAQETEDNVSELSKSISSFTA